ncbi:hypothetical protein GE21DRAFT_1935 [Neurospora crassa]|uniref:Uncharacterized protein n=2 Tax=Neurospora crassa TaxID=5141 RepID=Q7SFV5_NEUCR|nr:hypothetical protein NCU00774 [Neurospora crassa OR74A]EAA35694.1 hypothetical protein NCU00774 [Neurospora crassa OR74A]KHE83711.1 hypothetical protein GE21DRAFT_1935 [Neurospora crassa]CAE81943.1 hypothetical protein [Neurospora crassa]|eukprot:XP_964930.1 hypothetical protein NCU00774 [Neurospora crassa OR74A]
MTNLKSTADPPPYYPPSIADEITTWFLDEYSVLHKRVSELSRVLGHKVIIEADWQRLLDEFGEQLQPTLVEAASDIMQLWCVELQSILDHPDNDDWLTRLLTRLVKANGQLRVMLDVWEKTQLGTSWSDERNGFLVHLPKHFLFVRRALKRGESVIREEFQKELLSCFVTTANDKEDSNPELGKEAWTGTATESLKQLSVRDEKSGEERSSTAAGAAPAAACKTQPNVANAKTTTTSSASSTKPKPASFPTVASLPPLSEICSNPPYHITIHDGSRPGWISIHGSHGASLKLIDKYISKWTPDVVMESKDAPPTIDRAANGALTTLTIMKVVEKRGERRPLSVTMPMVLAIIEGTLGYEVVWQGSGEYRLRRDAPFV